MSEKPTYPIWEQWYDVAGPINKFIVWLTMALVVLQWAVDAHFWWFWMQYDLWRLIVGLIGCIIYLVLVMKPLMNKELTLMMHIGLMIAFVLVECASYLYWAGLLMTFQFVVVGIFSDRPFWVAFAEGK